MTGWRTLFNSKILRRGYDYYLYDAVSELWTEDEVIFEAVVEGSDSYDVTIELEDGNVKEAVCNCPYAEEHIYCKHIAAVLYEMENKYGKGIFKRKTPSKAQATTVEYKELPNIPPSPDKIFKTLEFNDDGKPHYLNLGNSLEIYKPTLATYNEAIKLIENKDVAGRSLTVTEGSKGKTLWYSIGVSGTHSVRIGLGKDGISEIRCIRFISTYREKEKAKCNVNSPNKDGIIELCVHKTAALISMLKFLEENRDLIDYSDETAKKLLSNFKIERKPLLSNDIENTILAKTTIDIEPNICTTGSFHRCETLSLKVQSSNGRFYKVRDIIKLFEAYQYKNEYRLATNNIIDFSNAELTERAKCVMEVIKQYEVDFALNRDNYYYRQLSYYKDMLPLSLTLDNLFEKLQGQEVLLNDIPLLGMEEVGPELTLKVVPLKEKGTIVGVKASGKISGHLKTDDYTYWVDKHYLKRTKLSNLGSAIALSNAANENGEFEFTVGLGLIDNFYQRMIPELRRYGKIEDDALDKLDGVLKEAPKYKFYLDIEEDTLTCKAVIESEGEEYEIYPPAYNYCTRVKSSLKAYAEDLIADLKELFPSGNVIGKKWTLPNNDDALYAFLTYSIQILMEKGEVNATDAVRNIVINKLPPVNGIIDIEEKEDGILNFELDTHGLSIEELVKILESYENKKKYHRLKNGSFVDISNVDLSALRELFLTSNLSIKDFVDGKIQLPLYRALYIEQILQENNAISLESGQSYRRLIKEFKTINESDYEVPESLKSIMRGYQKDGYRWMRVLFEHGFGGILADDMGLGKTLQTLAMLEALKTEGKEVKALIVSPASLVFNWRSEANKFTPGLKVCTVTGSAKEREAIIKQYNDYDILITSYDLLKRDIASYEDIRFNIEIIDEAQFIKNHNTAAAKAVRAIKSTHRLALTGTPIENRLSELWSIFEYLMPGFLLSHERFKKYISNPIEKDGDKAASERLRKLTGPFILRRIKSDVLKDLPDKIEETRITPLEGEQLKLYTAEVAKTKGMLKKSDNFKEQKIAILAELMKIREICCDPSLVFDNYKGESAKRSATLDLIGSAIDGGHKILLFSQFTSMLELLEKDLKKAGIEYYKITGETGKAKRMELVDSFNAGAVPLFLISLKAGGTGLNLTAADIVIHYDPWWNIAVQNQATDRAHRIGQTKRVTVYKMIAENTIEERIVKLQESKKDLANEIISTENLSLSTLSKEDLLDLLSIAELT